MITVKIIAFALGLQKENNEYPHSEPIKPPWYEQMIPLATGLYPTAIGFVIGAIAGSFIAAAIYRLPRQLSMLHPTRSFCPGCQQSIYWYDNIPLISFLALQGKCRFCHNRIDRTYPVVELLAAIGSAAIIYNFNDLQAAAWYLVLFYLLLAAGFIDARFYVIPNRLLTLISCIALPMALLKGIPFAGKQLLAAALATFCLWLVRIVGNMVYQRESFGWGDIKLGGILAFFLGFPGLLVSLFLAALMALGWVGLNKVFAGQTTIRRIPLAPFWGMATVVLIFLPLPLLSLIVQLPFLHR